VTQTPIAYIIFNRPQHTEKTFAVLQEQKPTHLFIIADGPRPGHPTDAQRCEAVRKIVEQVDWPCEVHRNYAESNLGLKKRVSSGLDWVFSQVERAIVLEDDCLAHPDFFRFCDALLDRYADDERVSVVTGNNFQDGRKWGDASYYFSKYNHCWGWATWRRAWRHYQGDIPFWPEWEKSDNWREKTPDPVERRYWNKIFMQVRAGKIDSWAYPWTGSVWYCGGLTATPNVNLVSNIGFGVESTHTSSEQSSDSTVPVHPLGELKHPSRIEKNSNADRYIFDHSLGGNRKRFPWLLFYFPRGVVSTLYRRVMKVLKKKHSIK
jgi:hypothetical protein